MLGSLTERRSKSRPPTHWLVSHALSHRGLSGAWWRFIVRTDIVYCTYETTRTFNRCCRIEELLLGQNLEYYTHSWSTKKSFRRETSKSDRVQPEFWNIVLSTRGILWIVACHGHRFAKDRFSGLLNLRSCSQQQGRSRPTLCTFAHTVFTSRTIFTFALLSKMRHWNGWVIYEHAIRWINFEGWKNWDKGNIRQI